MKLAAAAAFLLAFAQAGAETPPRSEFSVLGTKVSGLRAGATPGTVSVSSDHKHVVYFRKSTDGRKYSLVHDDEEGEQFDGLGEMVPLFSPDSKRVAFVGIRREQSFVVVDGKTGQGYDAVGGITFSPDSRRVAFMASRGDEHFVVLDGIQQPLRFDGLQGDGPLFSPDSSRLGYIGRRGSDWMVVVDGKTGKEYEGAGAFTFGPDSKHWACYAKRGEKGLLLFDGIESMQCDAFVRDTRLIFTSPYTVEVLAYRSRQIVHVSVSKLLNN